MPVLEAMACGAPVIMSNTTSLPEVAGDAAILVSSLDAGELGEAMVRVLSDDKLREGLRTKGYERVKQFTWERAARRTMEIYRGERVGGYRAYRASVLHQALAMYGAHFIRLSGFQATVDILLKLRRLPIICGEVPMILRYDLKKGASKMRVMRTARQTLVLILRRRLGDYS